MTKTPRRKAALLGVFLVAGAGTASVAADPFAPWDRVSEERLAEQRGGFLTANGLKVSVGLESLVRINGEPRTRSRVQVPDLSGLEGGLSLDSQVQVVQNGPGSTLPADLTDGVSGIGAFIQNTLNDQTVQHLKSLNIDISGVEALRQAQLGDRLNSQLLDSLR